MKKYAGYIAVKTGAGRDIYVRTGESYSLFRRILREYRSNYNFTNIMRLVYLLNADAHRGGFLNQAGDSRSISSGNIEMDYDLQDGIVFIQKLILVKRNAYCKAGLYSVSYSKRRREWRVSDQAVGLLDSTKQWQSDDKSAHYAAVAGVFDDIAVAGSRLSEHIVGAYKKSNLLTKSGAGDFYSLFWSEKGEHKSTESAQSLASIMQQSTKNKLPVNWLVHGHGTHTLINAAKILKTSPFASANMLKRSPDAGKIANQNVYFSNPAVGKSENELKAICEEAGLTYLGVNTNNRDLRRISTLKNVGREMGKALCGVALAGGGAGAAGVGLASESVGASGLGAAIGGIFNGLSAGNFVVLGAGMALTGFAVTSMFSKSKMLAAGIKCTIGRGNERWYTDDNALLS